jgi:hypothetical protein
MHPFRRAQIVGFALLGLAVLTVLAPNLIARSSLRDTLLQVALPKLNGRITSAGATLGWFFPVEYRQIEIRGADSQPVISIGELKGDRPLWKMLLQPRSVGTFVIEHARLDVEVKQPERGNNLTALIGAKHVDNNVGFGLQVVGGTLAVRSPGSPQAWTITPINLGLQMVPVPASGQGSAELILEKGTIVEHANLTPSMCSDLLKYVLPVLSETTAVSGEFSLALDGWKVPLDDPTQTTGSGQFSIHHVDVSSLMLQHLSQTLHIPTVVRLAENSVVQFKMADRRIEHQGLAFGTPQLTVGTQGSVGLDQSLDLLAEIVVHPVLDRELDLPLLKEPFKIPIRGTLRRPQVDLRVAGGELLRNLMGEVLKRKVPAKPDVGGAKDNGPLSPADKLEDWLKQRPLQKLLGDRKNATE